MKANNIRFIVFMLNPKTDQYLANRKLADIHEGEIFANISDAKEYAQSAIDDGLCSRFVIGEFAMDLQRERMGINCIETFGFKQSKKNINQLSLFNH